ncbi:MAG: HNH endonuclease [Candidatus Glassbacteria bacterium]|nr:HNH endonuclease [Candidatus Glassbacteria bacterium]
MLNTNVLVLNSSFQPLHVCHARRALVLVMGGKAEVVEYYEKLFVRSVTRCFQLPSVVRLRIYIRPDRRSVVLNRRNIMRRDRYRCQYCGRSSDELTTDHVIPRSKGGEDTWENLITACTGCNNRKGNRTPETVGMKLLSTPKRPAFYSFIRFYHPRSHDKWKPYLFLS